MDGKSYRARLTSLQSDRYSARAVISRAVISRAVISRGDCNSKPSANLPQGRERTRISFDLIFMLSAINMKNYPKVCTLGRRNKASAGQDIAEHCEFVWHARLF
jgi:hypothetical protein